MAVARNNLRVACIGAGYFSQYHYQAWKRIDSVELVGACDLDLSKAQATGVVPYSDLGKMLAETKPFVLDIISPPPTHAQAIRTALSFGIRTIICQKPFCTSLEEAREIVEEAEVAGANLIVHENFRFQPWYRAIHTSIQTGEIGRVLQASFRLRPGDGQGPNAYLDRQPYFQTMDRFLVHETAVHWIDTFRFLFGNPTSVYADLRKVNPVIAGEDAGIIVFDHPCDVRSVFDGNRNIDHSAENQRLTMGEGLFEGANGVLSLKGDGSVRRRLLGKREETVVLGSANWEGFGGDCVHAFQSHVVQALHNDVVFENTARNYLDVLSIEEAVYASAESNQKLTIDYANGGPVQR